MPAVGVAIARPAVGVAIVCVPVIATGNTLTNLDELCYNHGMREKTTNRNRPSACCTVADPGSLDANTLNRYAGLLTALADPTRLGIINLLANNDEPVCVCDITAQFDKGQPTISHHLSILREAGLIHGTRAGIWSFFTLDRARLAELQAMLAEVYRPLRGQPLPLVSNPLPAPPQSVARSA